MKKTFLLAFCFCGFTSFAQNGFFLQPEIGAGISNTCWQPYSPMGYPNQRSVFSYQGQVDIGYKAGKWQFITGIGYLRTGVKLINGTKSYFDFNNGFIKGTAEEYQQLAQDITDYNPHIILPIKIGYEVLRFNNKLSFTPFIGAELAYNMPRTFVYASADVHTTYVPTQKVTESQQDFNDNCNQYGVIGLVQLNFEDRLNEHLSLTGGPSISYMFTSMLYFGEQYDYAVLMNLGLKWNFKHGKTVAASSQNESLKS